MARVGSSCRQGAAGLDSRAVERRIELDGCVNFRDLGGYPTEAGRRLRWRVLFRSDALHALSASDVAHLRDEIGMSDVVDLRSSFELGAEGRGLLESEPIDFHHTPLFDGDVRRAETAAAERLTTLAERYIGMLELASGPIARVVEILSSARGAAVFHCAAGKDRTGVISAVLLGAVGTLGPSDLDRLWPRLRLVSAWDSSTAEPFADTLRARLGGVRGRHVRLQFRGIRPGGRR